MSDTVIEKLPVKFNIEKLKKSLYEEILPLGNPIIQSEEHGFKGFGGYSVLSRTGDWRDGFQNGDTFCRKKNGSFNYQLAKYLDVSNSFEYKNPTEACTPAFFTIINTFMEAGFYPRRARITVCKAHSRSSVHSDGSSEDYIARIHVPLITNEKCTHWSEKGEWHLPADGSAYMMWVNNIHQVRNDSDEDRYHLIMDAYDTKGLTKNFKYPHNIQEKLKEAEDFRVQMDKTTIPFYKLPLFYAMKQSIGKSMFAFQKLTKLI
jgi:hypothetical protein